VSIERVFAKYDVNRSGDIDATELSLLLEDLNVTVTEERLAQAFAVLVSSFQIVVACQ
jgi:Ca2+-binding EF-hand superfamily protein